MKLKSKGIAFFEKYIKVEGAYGEYINDENGESCFITLPYYEGINAVDKAELIQFKDYNVSCGKVSIRSTKEELATFSNYGLVVHYVNAYNLAKCNFDFNVQNEEVIIFNIKTEDTLSYIFEQFIFNKKVECKLDLESKQLHVVKSCFEILTKHCSTIDIITPEKVVIENGGLQIEFGGAKYSLIPNTI